MARLVTTLGDLDGASVGLVLPHEHVFVDLRTPAQGRPPEVEAGTWDSAPSAGAVDTDEVVEVMAPLLVQARAAGIGAIVEASTVGVGRRADILMAVSAAAGVALLVPTGVYREPWIPRWVHEAAEEQLAGWMARELAEGIEELGVRAGWIKLSAGDAGMSACEEKVLRAAARASAATGAAVGSHTIRGGVLLVQLEAFARAGGDPARFVWIHAQAETDRGLHREAARRGAWLEYDSIGGPEADEQVASLAAWALEAGLGDRVLLSQDRGWYDPAQPRGGEQKPYSYLVDSFLPRLRREGFDEATIGTLARSNPLRAFAR